MTVEIDRPQVEVFAFLSDLENDPRWRREWVEAKRAATGPIGVGTTTSPGPLLGGGLSDLMFVVAGFGATRHSEALVRTEAPWAS